MLTPDGEWHWVLYVEGIWIARRLVVLICRSVEYLAQAETAGAWSALMAPIPAPDVVVTDGGSGFAKGPKVDLA